ISMTPAFSPGPWITQGALVGSVRRWIFDDLYEQCSFHIAEKMPSSVKLGVRPISLRRRSYSSGLRPWAATSAGVIFGCWPAAFFASAFLAGASLAGAFFLAATFLAVTFLGAALRAFVFFAAGRSLAAGRLASAAARGFDLIG